MKLVVALLIILSSLTAHGQVNPNALISRQAAINDLSILQTAIYTIHPSTFRYTPREDFDNKFKTAMTSLPDSISIRQFANIVAPLVESIHCGHTYTMAPYINGQTKALPLEVALINDKLFITKNLSSINTVEPGAEIISINKRSATEIIQLLRNNEVGDGFVNTTKDRKIERFFKWQYATYLEEPDTFNVVLQGKNNETISISIPALVDAQIESNRPKREPQKPVEFKIERDLDLAMLRINSFMAKQIKKNHNQHLNKIIKKAFYEIKRTGTNNLVIDIRGNTGGMAYMPPFLYSYLGTEDFKFKDKLSFRHGYRFKNPEYLNRSKLNDWFNRILMTKVNDSTFEWRLHSNTKKKYHISHDAFKGKLFVLVDGMTASGAAEFATLVHYNKRGVLIGEESGGDYNGINGYDRTYLHLPNSKLGVLIAGYRSIMPWNETKYNGHGVPVDHQVQRTISDILNGIDSEMALVYSLLKK